MSSTQEDPPNSYMVTEEGDDFVPKNAKWTCYWGASREPYKKECGGRNEDIYNKICSKCGNKRGCGATADLGETGLSRGERGRFWVLFPNEDGSENWSTNFISD